MSFVLIGFGNGLRAKEVPLVSLEGMECFWDKARKITDPYIMQILHGCFKAETNFGLLRLDR